ncbi:hypothetical protein FNJ88_08325 [Chryseobacterium sp. SNU WT5]|uniref:hypothetical protein n=1 Tax=Chryseobacterium sp. SNU WT5 TaxID=2594269 RepID=UPI00117F65B1|nr:hypothetical protein [Chryseobacterium sp. SNU WT5]QDP85566.1 hypothetical protein FNJ88_08325 [Chryseobacterium sp. SNU WT5]
MELSQILLHVIEEKESVKKLVEKTKTAKNTKDEVKFSYQAFCCALMAKETTNNLQKIEYINAYAKYLNSALELNTECYEARLFRVSVEKKLQNVDFKNHITQDTYFLRANVGIIKDENLKKITNKILSL